MSTVRPRRATPRRRSAPRWSPDDWRDAEPLLLTRAGHRCERCRRPFGHTHSTKLERHHRQVRTIGGDRLANLAALCGTCHQDVHAHPEEARNHGWIVSRHHPDPAQVPIPSVGAPVYLRDDGTVSPNP